MNKDNKNQEKIVTKYGNEFSEDIDNPVGKVGLSPITGGLITRNLIKEAEEILMKNEQNTPKPNQK